MTHLYAKKHIFIVVFGLSVLLLTGVTAMAQSAVANADSDGKLPDAVITLNRAAMGATNEFLAVRDSIGFELSLISAELDGEPVWTRKATDAPVVDGTIQWHFHMPTRQLVLDLRGLSESFSDGKSLRLTVAPANARVKDYRITVFDAATVEAAHSRAQTALSGITIEFN